ncbi:DUF418 domain-containing protein [Lysobacter enzymogenes]|uniref:DUF418 domain-containing protein n=1 Tax=Lysobacter enzymogenes TaxID=69 RepID=A0AAU9AKB3_LYSEN|nr:DUF418 domain-containing protein [Lysobacter enzymogenes]BAV98984.1 conserved hypothetical protein [Lysobacter enzymogenes]
MPPTPASLELAPVPAPERIAALDALRGLALLGILLSNVAAFAGPLRELHDGIDASLHGGDYAWSAFVYVAIRDKAWTLFALLFGMGFASMLGRAPSAGHGFAAIYLRRSVGLLAIGLIHAWLIWAGDILVTYALCAFALLALRGWAPERWVVLGGALYASGIGFMLLIAASLSLPGVAVGDAAHLVAAQAERAAEVAAYASGDYAAATAQRWSFFFDATVGGWVVMLPLTLGLFLIGAGIARSGALADAVGWRTHWRAAIGWGGALGVALTAASVALDPSPAMAVFTARSVLAQALHVASGLPLALAATGAVALMLARGVRWPLRFAPAGRMALSHYLAQSLIATWALYGYGLGQWGRWSYSALMLAALVLFAAQMAFSAWWLRRFRFGPVEWLWRAFTYGRWPPLRVEPAQR